MITPIDKALIALIGAGLSIAAALGLNVSWASPEIIGVIGTVLTGLFTYLIPNKA